MRLNVEVSAAPSPRIQVRLKEAHSIGLSTEAVRRMAHEHQSLSHLPLERGLTITYPPFPVTCRGEAGDPAWLRSTPSDGS